MRIIRGRYQRRQINAPASLPVRPTTDMGKESLFNILENFVDFESVRALDLFSGTGNISYELVSRGCLAVTAVDKDNGCVRFIRETATKLQMNELMVVSADVFTFLKNHKTKYDLIFADPPYDCTEYERLISLVLDNDMLNENGTFIVEPDRMHDFSNHPRFKDHRKYGKVNFTFFA